MPSTKSKIITGICKALCTLLVPPLKSEDDLYLFSVAESDNELHSIHVNVDDITLSTQYTNATGGGIWSFPLSVSTIIELGINQSDQFVIKDEYNESIISLLQSLKTTLLDTNDPVTVKVDDITFNDYLIDIRCIRTFYEDVNTDKLLVRNDFIVQYCRDS